ncbi:MAG: D-alanyl-D-alanine carboxypeptidase [Candidatus Portnoybacteria bacterium]|nr:D-alanyl-D-alanine carboxypeptidase [Candidatus Portnoybacteria bacterium]
MVNFLSIIFIFLSPFAFLFGQFDVAPEQAADFNFNPGLANAISSIIISTARETNPNFLPIRNWHINQPEIEAKAALIFAPEKNKILYQKNIEQVLPIASLTKLMTGLVILEEMDLDQIVTVSKEAVAAYGDMGGLVIDEKISVKNLLYALLMESSNDAAVALAENFREASLVDLMNKKAEELGLTKTHFVDPTGYNPANLSTALDLAKLVKYSLEKPVIWQILKTISIDLSSADGIINHHFTNTNQLLDSWPIIIGGKTGYTDEAHDCMLLVIEQSSEYLIIIVLGTQERFSETEKLINWVKEAYIW